MTATRSRRTRSQRYKVAGVMFVAARRDGGAAVGRRETGTQLTADAQTSADSVPPSPVMVDGFVAPYPIPVDGFRDPQAQTRR